LSHLPMQQTGDLEWLKKLRQLLLVVGRQV
jgi:hypothetical protein